MWAPADIFGPMINAIALALKRAATFAANHLVYVGIAVGVVIALLVVISQLRSGSRR